MKPSKPMTRDVWRLQQDACFVPGCRETARAGGIMDCHEIIGASQRSKTIKIPAFWIFACRAHHDTFTSTPTQEQLIAILAMKLWADEEYADSKAVIKLWRPNCQPELVEEIIAAVNTEYRRIVRECA